MPDTDRSKLQVQTRLYQPPETPGTMFLYHSDNTQEHQALARSVVSKMQMMVDGKLLWKSDSTRPDDHILDALGIMLVGLEIEHAEANLVDDAQMEVIDREIKAAGY